jgi:MbtH protein
MPATEDSDDWAEYAVVINGEERYSIWPAHREVPAGWKPSGFQGPKETCLEHIDQVWTDMRPKSLREFMASPGEQQ